MAEKCIGAATRGAGDHHHRSKRALVVCAHLRVYGFRAGVGTITDSDARRTIWRKRSACALEESSCKKVLGESRGGRIVALLEGASTRSAAALSPRTGIRVR